MKDENVQSPLIQNWPDYSLSEIEKIDVEDKATRIFCNSFFRFLHLPETMATAFYTVLFENNLPF